MKWEIRFLSSFRASKVHKGDNAVPEAPELRKDRKGPTLVLQRSTRNRLHKAPPYLRYPGGVGLGNRGGEGKEGLV